MSASVELQAELDRALALSREDSGGAPASYIPELSRAPLEHTSAAITTIDGELLAAGDHETHRFTLQSSAKLVLLLGLLEERGPEFVFSRVGSEPSGTGFASVARLDTHGPVPANPLVNSGAIALCDAIPGSNGDRVAWLHGWAERLFGEVLGVNERVLGSERETGNRNRSIAYLLKSNGTLNGDVEETLETYFTLCSFETGVKTASRLPAILARGGLDRNGKRVVSRDVAAQTLSLMATCGMYDESGTHLRETGLPAKSGVSGVIVAVAVGAAGIAVASPRLNRQGGSIRGHIILAELAGQLGWHFGRV